MRDYISFWITLTFAVFLIGLGFYGYYKTGSLMSLNSSLTFGLLLIGTCVGMKRGKKWSVYAAPILAALLTITFTVRLILTHKPLPTMLATLSLALFLFLMYRNYSREIRQH